jgi:hypothetical protein
MAARKVTITLTEEVFAQAAEHARQAGLPLSAWISKAAEQRARMEDGLAAVAEWEKEAGPLTPEEIAEAEANWARADAELLRARRRAG